MHETTALPPSPVSRYWPLVLGLIAFIGVAVADRATHPASVMMTVEGVMVESKVLGYGGACTASGGDFSKVGGMSEPLPVRGFTR